MKAIRTLAGWIGMFSYWTIVLVALIATLGSMIFQTEVMLMDWTSPHVIRLWSFVVVVLFATTGLYAVHEFGHLLAAWAARIEVLELRVLSFVWDFHKRTRVNAPTSTEKACVKALYPLGRFGRARWAAFLLGGPLANLIVGILFLASAIALNGGIEPVGATPRMGIAAIFGVTGSDFFVAPRSNSVAIATFVASYSLFMAILNLIPMSDRLTDGSLLRNLFKMQDAAKSFRVGRAYRDLSAKRPREWDLAAIQGIAEVAGNRQFMLEYYHHIDSGRVDEARQCLDGVLKELGDRPDFVSVHYEAAYFAARHLVDVTAAKAAFDKAGGKIGGEPQTRPRAEAAILFAERKFSEARDKAWEAIALMRTTEDVSSLIAEREWLAAIAIEAEMRRTEAVDSR